LLAGWVVLLARRRILLAGRVVLLARRGILLAGRVVLLAIRTLFCESVLRSEEEKNRKRSYRDYKNQPSHARFGPTPDYFT
jgi:hypothetical protein